MVLLNLVRAENGMFGAAIREFLAAVNWRTLSRGSCSNPVMDAVGVVSHVTEIALWLELLGGEYLPMPATEMLGSLQRYAISPHIR